MYKDFPNKLKLAEITLFFQNEDFTSFCVKIFWENNTKTVISINRKLFLPFFRGCKKGFSFHCAVLWLVQKWKVSFYKKGYVGLVIIDLSKAFDPITHELVFSKLNAYGLNKNSLEIMRKFLTNCWQKAKISKTFSS